MRHYSRHPRDTDDKDRHELLAQSLESRRMGEKVKGNTVDHSVITLHGDS